MAEKGFFESLFDFSFSVFITVRLVRVIYGLWLTFLGLIWLFILFAAWSSEDGLTILGALVVTPVLFVFSAAVGRLILEQTVVGFRIADHTRDTATHAGDIAGLISSSGGSSTGGALSHPSDTSPGPATDNFIAHVEGTPEAGQVVIPGTSAEAARRAMLQGFQEAEEADNVSLDMTWVTSSDVTGAVISEAGDAIQTGRIGNIEIVNLNPEQKIVARVMAKRQGLGWRRTGPGSFTLSRVESGSDHADRPDPAQPATDPTPDPTVDRSSGDSHDTDEQEAGANFCPQCGTHLEIGQRFCKKCGKRLE